jgi:hypothetical protein
MAKKTTAINVRVEQPEKEALEGIAAQEELELSDIVRRALRRFIAQQQPHRAPANYGNS